MMTLRQAFPLPVIIVCTAAVVLQIALALQIGMGGTKPYDVALGISAPPIVAQVLVERANALPDHPVEARALTDRDDARAAIRDGSVTAALVVDLLSGRDILLVSDMEDPDLTRSITVLVQTLGATYGRALEVERVPPAHNREGSRIGVYLLTGTWILLGFLLSVGISLARGPVASTWSRAVGRVAGVGVACVGLGLLVALVASATLYSGTLADLWLHGTATMLAASWTTLTLESLAGLAGIGVATGVFLMLATPFATFHSVSLFPAPWSVLIPWTPWGAAIEATTNSVFFTVETLQPRLVLTAWVVLPLLTMILARRERRREEDRTGFMSSVFVRS